MSDPARKPMTSAAFIAWAMEQPEGERYELVAGVVVAMAPERSAHALGKFHIARRLAEAVEAAKLACTVYPDGMAVEIDDATTYEPDALVRCGPALPLDAIRLTDPVIIVEVASPSTRGIDAGVKFSDYFRLPSLHHYLIVRLDTRAVVHHSRDAAGTISSRIVREGPISLDPPGLLIDGLFASER